MGEGWDPLSDGSSYSELRFEIECTELGNYCTSKNEVAVHGAAHAAFT